ncbi:hypothetical protein EMPS_07551 [Entomortierella parvispora]|uniref:Chromo domain-containing protein n=1 Tax=Entomortierella parvispora TaxID=205924 RepID=A0A9P3HER8_9FUNG|nr:hypothetical protein EMPS_07551 [Entomortierella parvispora]
MGTDHHKYASDSSPDSLLSSGQQRRPARSGPGTKAKKLKIQKEVELHTAEEVEVERGEQEEEVVEEKEVDEQEAKEEDNQQEEATLEGNIYTILQLALPSGSIVTEDALERASRAFGAIIKEASASAAATVAGIPRKSTLRQTARQSLKKRGKAAKLTLIKDVRPKKVKDAEAFGEKYEVEAITGHEKGPRGNYVFLIKWKGYPISDCTWEPRKSLTGCQEILADYLKLHNLAV